MRATDKTDMLALYHSFENYKQDSHIGPITLT